MQQRDYDFHNFTRPILKIAKMRDSLGAIDTLFGLQKFRCILGQKNVFYWAARAYRCCPVRDRGSLPPGGTPTPPPRRACRRRLPFVLKVLSSPLRPSPSVHRRGGVLQWGRLDSSPSLSLALGLSLCCGWRNDSCTRSANKLSTGRARGLSGEVPTHARLPPY